MDWSLSGWVQWIYFCEHGDEHLVQQKGREVFDYMKKLNFLSALL